MFEDADRLRTSEPPLLRARPDITDRILRRIEEEEQLARWRRRRTFRVATAVVSTFFCLMVWRWFTQPIDGPFRPVEAHRKPPAPAPAPRTQPVTAPAVSAPTTTAVARQHAPAKKKKTEAAPPVVVQTDTTGTFPAPPPEIVPYRPNVQWAHDTIGPDGQPVSPTQPPVGYRHQGLRHPPIAPPGTPKVHDMITVTAPPTTTTNPPTDTTSTNPPTGTQQ